MSGVAQAQEEVQARAAMPGQEHRAGKNGPQPPEAPAGMMVHAAPVGMTARVLAPDPKDHNARNVPQGQEVLAVMPMQEVLVGMKDPLDQEAPAAMIVPPKPEVRAATTAQVVLVPRERARTRAGRRSLGRRKAAMSAPSARVTP